MGALLLRRFASLFPILLVVSIFVFGLTALVPGDVAFTLAGGENATHEQIDKVRRELGLDRPVVERYGRWLADAVRLDFGKSFVTGRPVTEDFATLLPITASVVFAAVLFAVLVGATAGVLAGMQPGTGIDRALILLTTVGVSIPNFWLGIMLIVVFAIEVNWFPAIGFTPIGESFTEWLRAVTLPAIALGAGLAAALARQVRAALSDVMRSNYVRTAWAKGGTARVAVAKHALKNAAIPAVTVLGLQIGALLGGTVILERIFSIPGLGSYILTAVVNRDIPVIQGTAMMFVLIYVVLNLLVDLTYGFLNPKVRLS